jgi:hypothetical protein
MEKSLKQQKKNNYNKEYRLKNIEKVKEYTKKNNAKYRNENKSKLTIQNKEYLIQYRKINKVKINEQNKLYNLNKRKINPLYKFKCNLRSLLNGSMKKKGYIKNSKTNQIIGCTIDELIIYLESKFESWMNWDNYGNPKDNVLKINKTWDIDHIIPMCTAITEEDAIRLNHYNNLQPLCSYTNRLIKKDKILSLIN